MKKGVFDSISMFRIYLIQKKKYCYIMDNKNNRKLLVSLWEYNLIWGYQKCKEVLKVYFRYYLNRSIIYSIFTLNRVLDYNFFKKYNQKYPQTFLIINTSRGIRTIDFCIKNNLGGKLVLRLN
jgi:ribosomal protein S8